MILHIKPLYSTQIVFLLLGCLNLSLFFSMQIIIIWYGYLYLILFLLLSDREVNLFKGIYNPYPEGFRILPWIYYMDSSLFNLFFLLWTTSVNGIIYESNFIFFTFIWFSQCYLKMLYLHISCIQLPCHKLTLCIFIF